MGGGNTPHHHHHHHPISTHTPTIPHTTQQAPARRRPAAGQAQHLSPAPRARRDDKTLRGAARPVRFALRKSTSRRSRRHTHTHGGGRTRSDHCDGLTLLPPSPPPTPKTSSSPKTKNQKQRHGLLPAVPGDRARLFGPGRRLQARVPQHTYRPPVSARVLVLFSVFVGTVNCDRMVGWRWDGSCHCRLLTRTYISHWHTHAQPPARRRDARGQALRHGRQRAGKAKWCWFL